MAHLLPYLKHRLRPAVRAIRDARARFERWLRPEQRWDGHHHPVLYRFPPWRGVSDGRFFYDFLGVRTDPKFKSYFKPDPPGPILPGYPSPTPSYFELVFVLESVVAACSVPRPSFTMIELGAGYGPWLVTAHHAVRMLDPTRKIHLVGVEMNARHVDYMREHMANNDIAPASFEAIHAAVSDVDGTALFVEDPDRSLAYGQHIRQRTEGQSASGAAGAVRVACVGAANLLSRFQDVDLVHIDVQGEEARILSAAMPVFDRVVRRVLVATHSSRTHRRVRAWLLEHGWEIVWGFRCRKRQRTQFGDCRFQDGLIAGVNPRHTPLGP